MEEKESEEDAVIAMLQETRATNYCDPSFNADGHALYRVKSSIPEYDVKNPGPIRWVRFIMNGHFITGQIGCMLAVVASFS